MTGMHPCYARSCDVQVPRWHLMCHRHWWKVPALIRWRVKLAYRNRVRDGWEPWLEAANAAREALEDTGDA